MNITLEPNNISQLSLPDLVSHLIEKHTGGQAFFDELDNCLACENIFQQLTDKIYPERVIDPFDNIICSGKFGEAFSKWYKENYFIEPFKLPGSLRNNDIVSILIIAEHSELHSKNFIFVDDSFYSGSTFRMINKLLEPVNSKIIQSFVVYDGSKEPPKNLQSLYRYYEHH
jgi:hypothetical protein